MVRESARSWVLSIVFLAIGLYSVVSMERHYHNVSRLTAYVVLVVPAFFLFYVGLGWYERLDPSAQLRRRYRLLRSVSRSAPQNLIQYVFAFCLPFFSMSQAHVYQGFTILLLASTLWEPVWTKLLVWWPYRRVLQAWSLIAAGSFLFPFFFPDRLQYFYPVLAALGCLPFVPVRRHKRHLLGNLLGVAAVLLITLGTPAAWRFPVLSVWVQDPSFEWDTLLKNQPHPHLPPEAPAVQLIKSLSEDHNLCCLAPVVAPPGVQERVTQEWKLNQTLIERPELPTTITGNSDQKAFRSYYCKKRFPALEAGQTLSCRLYLQSHIYLGEVKLRLTSQEASQ